jgi:hypothetical protein
MDAESAPAVSSSTKIWIGTTVTTVLGFVFGVVLITVGSFLTWQADGVLGLFDVSGWNYRNIITGDGKITLLLGVVVLLGMLGGLLMQSRAFYMLAVISGFLVLGISIYELVQIASSPGIAGPGHGLYMVLGGGVGAILCGFCGYSMMAEKRRSSPGTAAGDVSGGKA